MGGACENVDECADDADNDCDENAQCTDIDGSYECECLDGFEGNGFQCIGECIRIRIPICIRRLLLDLMIHIQGDMILMTGKFF